jgi:hypothetical protein
MARRPMLFISHSPDETARALLLHCGSLESAHQAITRNKGVLKRPKRDVPDSVLLLQARSVQRKEKCRDYAALRSVAYHRTTDVDAAEALLKRLWRTLKKKDKSLARFASRYPEWALPVLEE